MLSPRKSMRPMGQWTPPIVQPGSVSAKPKRGMFGELPQPQKAKNGMGWAEGAGVLGAMLRDLDGGFGQQNLASEQERMIAFRAEQERKALEEQQRKIREMAAMGDPTALAYLDPLGNRSFEYQKGQDVLANQRADRGIDLQSRGVDLQEQGLDQSADQFQQTLEQRGQFHQDEMGYRGSTLDEDRRQFDATYGLNRDKLAIEEQAAERERARTPGSLQGLPSGVQSAIVRDQLGKIEEASAASDSAEQAANLAKQFMGESDGYRALGGGPLADIGQMFSQKTARLKGITAEMIPMMRQAGEGIMTDADAKRYESAVVSINKGRGANQDVANILEAGKENAKQYESWLREFVAEGGYGDQQTAELIWDEYQKENPLFGDDGAPSAQRLPIRDWLTIKQEQASIDAEIAALEAEEGGQ